MGGKRRNKKDKKSGNGKMKTSNRNTNKQNEKPERTDDSGTPSQDDREDSTQRLSLEEAEKNKSDHDMSPNEKEGKEMEALGENNGNDNDDHGGKKPFETPRSEVCEHAKFQDDNIDGRNNYPRNNVNGGTESNNEHSTSEEGKSSKAEITSKSDGANKIETTVTIDAKSDDQSQQSFQTSETERDSIDTEEQHRDNNTIKIEKGKQDDHNRMDKIESQTEHMNMDANQQNGEDGGKTNDIAMTQSNNDQTTPEKDQPIHMERTTESIGVNGEKIGVSPSQSFHTGDIKDNQMDNDNTSTKTDTCYNEDEPMSSHSSEYGTDRGIDETPSSNASLNPQKKSRGVLEEDTSTESNDVVRKDLVREETVVASDAKSGDDSPSQSVQNGNIEHDNINSEEMQRSASHTTIGSTNTSITMTPVQGLPSGAFGDDVGDPGVRNKEIPLDENEAGNNNVVGADNFENEEDSIQSPTSATNMAHFQGSDETHNSLSDIQNQSREISEKNTSAESNDVLTDDVVVETTVVASDAKSGDDSPSQSVQNENIEHDNINSEEMQRSASPTTIDSPNTSITMTPVQGLPSGAFGDDVGDPGVRNGEVDNDSTSTEAENYEDETMSHVNEEKTAVDDGTSQSFQTGNIKDDQMDGTEERHHHGHVDQQNGQVDNDSTSTKADNNEDEPMSPQSSEYGTDRGSDENPSSNASLNPRKEDTSMEPSDEVRETTVVASVAKSGDDNTLQSVENENIENIDRGNINSEGMQCSASPNTIDSPNTYTTMKPVQGQSFRAFGDDVGDPGLRNGEMSLDENEPENNNVVSADNYENEMVSFQSPTSGTNMAHYQGSDETHNSLSDIQNQSREVSEKNTSAESNDVLREDAVVETTVIASDANSGDDYTSQSVQNENIDHSNINSEEMQRSASTTTIDSPNSSITTTPVQEQPSRAFGDDVSDSGLRNGELSLYENETENDNVVNADNFENEMDSPQSSESGNDMAHYEGSNETLSFNLLSDIQLKTSQEKEIEKLQRELNIKNENLATLKEEMKRRDEIINEKNSENADLLHRCVALETSAEAADDLREQCEDKNHQIETLEGDLASVRNENESLKRHLEEIENVAADHQRLIDENKSLDEYLEQERQSSAALKEETQALKEQITNNEDVLKEFESQIKKAIEEKEELGAKLASRNENNSDLLSNYLEMKKKEEEMAAELKKMQENYQHEKRRSEELSDQLSLRNKEVITTENKYKQEIEELKAKYKTEKDQAEKEKELLKQCVTKLNEGSQQLQAENKRIKDDLQLKSKECGNLKSERLRITGELDAAKKEIAELSNERDKLGAYITTVNDEVRQLRAALELKEAEKNAANECMQKVVREKQEMMYSMGNLQRIELENHRLKHQNMDQSEQITKLHASLQEYGLLRDHIQEYYKALQDSQMELQREKEKSRHINELLSKTGYRLDLMASELNNYRTMTEGYRRSLEEEKEKSNKLERKLDRLTIDNEKLTEERDKCEQKSFEYKDECRSLREDLEKSQAECRDLLSQTQEGASDGTTSLLQGNYFTSTSMGNGFGKPSSQSNFVFGIGGD